MNVGDVIHTDAYVMAMVSPEFVPLLNVDHACPSLSFEYLDEGMMIVIDVLDTWFTTYFPKMCRFVYLNIDDIPRGMCRVDVTDASV